MHFLLTIESTFIPLIFYHSFFYFQYLTFFRTYPLKYSKGGLSFSEEIWRNSVLSFLSYSLDLNLTPKIGDYSKDSLTVFFLWDVRYDLEFRIGDTSSIKEVAGGWLSCDFTFKNLYFILLVGDSSNMFDSFFSNWWLIGLSWARFLLVL